MIPTSYTLSNPERNVWICGRTKPDFAQNYIDIGYNNPKLKRPARNDKKGPKGEKEQNRKYYFLCISISMIKIYNYINVKFYYSYL